MPEIRMPRLSDSMEEGTIVRWIAADGDTVTRGEPIVEIETDKATMEYEADEAGVLCHLVAEGDAAAVGAAIATVGDDAPLPAAPVTDAGVDADVGDHAPAAPARGAATPARSATLTGVSASPVARRFAAAHDLEIGEIAGSGPHGRVLKADVRAALEAHEGAAGARPEPSDSSRSTAGEAARADARGVVQVQEPTRLQQTVARRMAATSSEVPEFAVSVDIDMSEVVTMRERLRGRVDPMPSVNDVLVKAAAHVLRDHPRVNGAFVAGRFESYERINVGVAVAADDALVVPVVHDADRESLSAVARETRRLAAAVRDGTVTPAELAGCTFTISNLGMFGVDRFEGIINVPQAAILCVGATVERPVAVAGEVVVRPMMTATLVADHRILYGADVARFLAALRAALEDPLAALI